MSLNFEEIADGAESDSNEAVESVKPSPSFEDLADAGMPDPDDEPKKSGLLTLVLVVLVLLGLGGLVYFLVSQPKSAEEPEASTKESVEVIESSTNVTAPVAVVVEEAEVLPED